MGDETNFFNLSAREEKKAPEVLDWVEKHFTIRHNVVYARAKFNTRNQGMGESVNEYFVAVSSLAEHCNYGQLKEELIRDRIVVGIRHKALSEQLIYKQDLTLDETLDIVRMFEESLVLNEDNDDCNPVDLEEEKAIKSEHLKLDENLKLNEACNGFNPDDMFRFNDDKTMVQRKNMEEMKTEGLFRMTVLDILNNPTWEKYVTILEQITELPIDTKSRLKVVIDLIFEKAADEPDCTDIYASVCKHLRKKAVPSDADENSDVNFWTLLLLRCEREFERDNTDEINRDNTIKHIEEASQDEKKKIKEELEEERKVRRRCIGITRFIGELYKLGMLTSIIVYDCLNKLLKQGNEDSLECLCRLMTTIGKELSENTASDKIERKKMNSLFKKIKQIVNSADTSCEARFMLQDLMGLRLRNWLPSTEDNNFKTIEQYRIEFRQIQTQHPPQQTLPERVDIQYRSKDQWSPLNPEGKKQYDRAFLITLQSKPMSLQKPKGLPDLDIIKDTPLQHKIPLQVPVPSESKKDRKTKEPKKVAYSQFSNPSVPQQSSRLYQYPGNPNQFGYSGQNVHKADGIFDEDWAGEYWA